VGGILRYRGLVLLGVMAAPDRPGLAAAIFQVLGQACVNVQFIVQSIDLNNESHVLFCVAEEDWARALELLAPVADQVGSRRVTDSRPVALISVFGPDFRERPGIAGLAFGALAEAGINILAVSTSISTVSCVVEADAFEAAIAALGNVFALP
jgi:aspartate kinase